jgi:hypothetical protein
VSTARREARVGVFVTALAVGAAGCTLVSGWSDLQHGSVHDAAPGDGGGTSSGGPTLSDGAPNPTWDASAEPDTGGGSGSGGDAAPDADLRVVCNGIACALGSGCCVPAAFGFGTCAQATQCRIPDGFMACTDSTVCTAQAGAPSFCCSTQAGGFPTSSCKTKCDSNEQVACNPANPASCAAGETCRTSQSGSYSICQ